jgi:hypothetical protein
MVGRSSTAGCAEARLPRFRADTKIDTALLPETDLSFGRLTQFVPSLLTAHGRLHAQRAVRLRVSRA